MSTSILQKLSISKGILPIGDFVTFSPTDIANLVAWFNSDSLYTNDAIGRQVITSMIGDTSRPPQVGKKFKSDGVNDTIEVPTLSSSSTSGTIIMEIKLDNAIPGGTKDGLARIGQPSSALATRYPFNDGNIYMGLLRAGRIDAITPSSVDVTGWHKVIVTTTPGADGWKFYQDNTLVHQTTGDATLTWGDPSLIMKSTTSGVFFEGEMSRVRVYERAITSAEVTDVNNEVEIDSTGILIDYKCEDDGGEKVFDSSGNGNHGTIVNHTESTFFVEDETLRSYQNEDGYSGGIYFNGSGKLTYPTISGNWEDIEFDIFVEEEITSSSDFEALMSEGTGAVPLLSFGNVTGSFAGETLCILTSSGVATYITDNIPAGYHTLKLSWNGTSYDFIIDGVAKTTFTGSSVHHPLMGNDQIIIAGRGGTGTYSSLIRNFSIKEGGVKIFDAPLQVDIEDKVSGVDGTWSGTVPSFSKIPADDSSPLNDIYGVPLYFAGQVAYSGLLKQSHCGDFDGSNDSLVIGNVSTFSVDGLFVEAIIKPDAVGNTYIIANSSGGGSSSNSMGLKVNGSLQVNLGDGSNFEIVSSGVTPSTTEWTRVKAEIITGFVRFTINGEVIDVARTITPTYQDNTWAIGRFGAFGGLYFNGQIAMVKVGNSSGDIMHYTFSQGVGSEVQDVAGGNHGTATNITESSFWGTTQDEYHYNLIEGFSERLYFDGVSSGHAVNYGNITELNFADTDTFSLRATIKPLDATEQGYVFGKNITARGYALYWDGTVNTFAFATSSNVLSAVSTAITLPSGSVQIRADFDAGTVIFFTRESDGDTWTQLNTVTGVTFDSPISEVLMLGNRNGGSVSATKFAGVIHSARILDNTGSVVFDSETSTEGVLGSGIKYVKIPAQSPTLDVFGDNLTNPPSPLHNGAETLIDFKNITESGLTPYALRNLPVAFANYDGTQTTDNPAFVSGTEAILFEEVLSGTDLTNVNNYLN